MHLKKPYDKASYKLSSWILSSAIGCSVTALVNRVYAIDNIAFKPAQAHRSPIQHNAIERIVTVTMSLWFDRQSSFRTQLNLSQSMIQAQHE